MCGSAKDVDEKAEEEFPVVKDVYKASFTVAAGIMDTAMILQDPQTALATMVRVPDGAEIKNDKTDGDGFRSYEVHYGGACQHVFSKIGYDHEKQLIYGTCSMFDGTYTLIIKFELVASDKETTINRSVTQFQQHKKSKVPFLEKLPGILAKENENIQRLVKEKMAAKAEA